MAKEKDPGSLVRGDVPNKNNDNRHNNSCFPYDRKSRLFPVHTSRAGNEEREWVSDTHLQTEIVEEV